MQDEPPYYHNAVTRIRRRRGLSQPNPAIAMGLPTTYVRVLEMTAQSLSCEGLCALEEAAKAARRSGVEGVCGDAGYPHGIRNDG